MSVWPSARWDIDVPDARLVNDERFVGVRIELPEEPSAPDWITELRQTYALRIRDWLAQTWMLLVSPMRTMDAWMTGELELLNPPRFFAFGVALSYLVEKGSRWLLHVPKPTETWWLSLLHGSSGALLMTCVGGAMMHFPLRWKGKAPLRASMAATIYASAGPGIVLRVAGWLLTIALYFLVSKRVVEPSIFRTTIGAESGEIQTPFLVQLVSEFSPVWTIAALAGVHRLKWWWPLLAIFGIFAAFTLVIVLLVLASVLWKELHHP